MLKIPLSHQTCSSSPINALLISALKVVLPVPERPNNKVVDPSAP